MTLDALAPRLAGAVLRARFGEVPVVPDADEGRDWLERELLDPAYHERPSLLQLLLDWLSELFADAPGLGLDGPLVALAVVAVLALVAGIAFWVAGPVRRARAGTGAGAVLSGDDTRTARQLRDAADAAAQRGDWHDAVADRFRALVRSLEERAVLDERPGRTAHEAVEAAGERLPGVAGELRDAGRLFDDVVYGDQGAGPADDALLREIDTRTAAARPVLVLGGVVPGYGDDRSSVPAPTSERPEDSR